METTAEDGWQPWLARWFWPLVAVGVAVNLSGLPLTIMEPDAALYATVARVMAETGNFQDLIARGTDWLDKPHFPFWVTALSFRLFGINTVAYKLPGLFFWGLGVLYTYRYAKLLWTPVVARVAVLLLLTAEHLILSNTDVRAEPFLVGLIVAALYHFVRAQQARGLTAHLVWGALFAACAVMTKGLFVLLPVVGALTADAFARRRPLELLALRWWIAAALVLVFITPELIALYRQFDLHPEKRVFDRTGVSGVRFFFWDSQFGRFFNTGPIRGRGDPTFFLHTTLWAFLPWSLWLVCAVVARVVPRWRPKGGETYSLGAAGLTFLVFSASRFQLPHYLNILFPFLAVITAAWVCSLVAGTTNAARAQRGIALLITALALGLPLLARPALTTWAVAFVVGSAAVAVSLFRRPGLPNALGLAFSASAILNLVLTVFIYPTLLRHQGGSEAAKVLNAQPPRPTGMFAVNSYAFEFYATPTVQRWDLPTLERLAKEAPIYLYFPEGVRHELDGAGLEVRELAEIRSYPVTRISGRFLNPTTRESTLSRFVLGEVSGKR